MKKHTNNSVTARLLKYIARYKKYIIIAFASAMGNVAATLAAPVLVGRAIDNIIEAGRVDYTAVMRYLVYTAAFIAAGVLCGWIMNIYTQKAAGYSVRDFRADAFKRLNEVPISYIDSSNQGDVVSRLVNDAELVAEGIQQTLTQLLPGIVTILGTLGVMIALNWLIALVVIVITPASIFLAAFVAKKCRQTFLKQAKAQGDMSGYINETVNNENLVRLFGAKGEAAQSFSDICDEYYKHGVKAQFFSSVTNPSTRFVNGIVYAAVCVFGAMYVIKGGITVGRLSCFLTYANQYTKPFNEISGVVTQLQTALTAAARVFEVLDAEKEKPDFETAVKMEECRGNIEIKNVAFSYLPEKPLITDFNLNVKQGQRVAIVGPTGCGKTTLINLLMRFYDVTGGKITVDGVDIRDIYRDDLRGLFGMVLQETWLQEATVAENIAYADKNADRESIVQAAKASYCHNFIMGMPQGYDTVLKKGGANLSAGQRQLLCIARIMLAKPNMLILDEATSSIDTRTEMLISRAFEKLMKNRTSFVVAHRLSTIQSADIILVMNKGNVIEQGTHTELLAKNGFYAKLYKSQFEVS